MKYALLFALILGVSSSSFAATASGFCKMDDQPVFGSKPNTIIATYVFPEGETRGTIVMQYYNNSTAGLRTFGVEFGDEPAGENKYQIHKSPENSYSFAKFAKVTFNKSKDKITQLLVTLDDNTEKSFSCE